MFSSVFAILIFFVLIVDSGGQTNSKSAKINHFNLLNNFSLVQYLRADSEDSPSEPPKQKYTTNKKINDNKLNYSKHSWQRRVEICAKSQDFCAACDVFWVSWNRTCLEEVNYFCFFKFLSLF